MLEFEKCIELRFEGQVSNSIAFVNIFATTTVCHERRRSTESSPPRNVVTVHTTVHPYFQISVASSARSIAAGGNIGALKRRKTRLVALSCDEIRRKTRKEKGDGTTKKET